MQALIFGYYGFGNVGDEATLSVLIKQLICEGFKPVVVSNDPERVTRLHCVKSIKAQRSSHFFKYFITSSLFVFAGGGRYGKTAVRWMCLFSLIAKLLKKKVFILATGIYPYSWIGTPVVLNSPVPFNDLPTKLLIRLTFKLVDSASVRDDFSKKVLLLSGVDRKISVEKDFVFKLNPSSSDSYLPILAHHGVNLKNSEQIVIGVNLRTLTPSVNYRIISVMAAFLDKLIASNVQIVFVPFGYESTAERFFDNDLLIYNQLKMNMQFYDKIRVIDKEYHPRELLGIFNEFDLFVGMRFHSIVYSLSMHVPVIALVYDTKTIDLLREEKNSLYYHFDLYAITENMLINAVKDLIGVNI